MRYRLIVLILLISSLLTGCVIMTPYTCDPNKPQATLGVLNFNMLTNEIIISQIYQDPYQCKYPQCFSRAYITGKSRLINANQLTTFMVTYLPPMPILAMASPLLACTCLHIIYTSFVPKAGHSYFITGINHSHKGYSDDKLSLIISDRIVVSQNEQQTYAYKVVRSIRRDCHSTNSPDLVCNDSEYVKQNMKILFPD